MITAVILELSMSRIGEENEENSSYLPSILSDEDDRCPICLNCLAGQEVGFPENCHHIFCMTCILKWAETRASCPIDRKPFQVVYKLCALEECIKVQIKQPLSKADDLLCCNEGKYCPVNMKNCISPEGKPARTDFSEVICVTDFLQVAVLLENLLVILMNGCFKKGHVVTYVQDGEEKKQTSGTAGTRGSRKKISDNTPRRRSARNVKTESLGQSQNSPRSSSSGCEASGDGSSFVNASCAESEKLPPKRKAKRGAKQQEPFVKKKLRSSGCYGKSSSDIVEGESETDKTLLVDKDNRPDIENLTSGFSHKNDVETQSANGLETLDDLVESQEPARDSDQGQGSSDVLDTVSCAQEPPLLTPEDDTEKCEINDDPQFENQSCCENEQPDHAERAFREGLCNATVTHHPQKLDSPRDELPGKLEIAERPVESPEAGVLEKSEDVSVADEALTVPGNESLVGVGSVTVADEPLSSPQNEFLGEPESVAVADKPLPDAGNELLQEPEAVTTLDKILERPRNEMPEGALAGPCSENELSQQAELVTVAKEQLDSPRSKLQEIPMLLGMEEATPEEKEANGHPDNENGADLLIDNNFIQSLEESRKESPRTPDTEEVKYFSEDNNEIVAMECDSFSSDQNESRLDQPLVSGNVEPEADSLLQDTEHSMSFSSSSEKKEEMECSTELHPKDKKTRTRRNLLQGTKVDLRVEIEIVTKKGQEETMTEREVGGDGHGRGLGRGPDPGQEAKALRTLEMRGMAIRLLDGKNGGQMTTGEVPKEMTDPNFKDQTSQQGDGAQLSMNMLQPQMSVLPPVSAQPQPVNLFPYPLGVPAPIMNIQHNPFALPPPVPLQLPTGVPLVQVAAPANVSQGPPPPPPPPPPSQQVNYVASQFDGKQLQAAPGTSHAASNTSAPLAPALPAALGSGEAAQGPSAGNATSSSNVRTSNAAVKLAESKKLLIQEKAAQEVKLAIKPFYQNKDISKEEYKEIVRKAVDKVCHSKSGEVNSAKVANLVKAYVDKYKHSRKKNPEEIVSVERK
ncbi:hypothetical protein lerEdw1_009005 [Lerista edwardsae]|nr:hypothetical protein lerEdw1_009005 [Lerista edwardsae]